MPICAPRDLRSKFQAPSRGLPQGLLCCLDSHPPTVAPQPNRSASRRPQRKGKAVHPVLPLQAYSIYHLLLLSPSLPPLVPQQIISRTVNKVGFIVFLLSTLVPGGDDGVGGRRWRAEYCTSRRASHLCPYMRCDAFAYHHLPFYLAQHLKKSDKTRRRRRWARQ